MGKIYPRLAIIGCGAVVEQFHLPALKNIGWNPVICIDPNIKQAESIAKRFKTKSDASYIDSTDLFDVAIIAVPHTFHKNIATDLLEKNKHILIEKPIASTSNEAKEIINFENKSKGRVQVGLLRRYLDSMIWLKKSIAENYFGKISKLSVYEGGIYTWPVKSDSFWDKNKSGGGVLLDTGAHTIDLLLWIFGNAELINYRDDSLGGVEADCSIKLKFYKGFNADVELSRTRALGAFCVIHSEKGIIKFSLVSNKVESISSTMNIDIPEFPKQSFNALANIQLTKWLDSINNGSSVAVSSSEALKSVALIQKCYYNKQDLGYSWL